MNVQWDIVFPPRIHHLVCSGREKEEEQRLWLIIVYHRRWYLFRWEKYLPLTIECLPFWHKLFLRQKMLRPAKILLLFLLWRLILYLLGIFSPKSRQKTVNIRCRLFSFSEIRVCLCISLVWQLFLFYYLKEVTGIYCVNTYYYVTTIIWE